MSQLQLGTPGWRWSYVTAGEYYSRGVAPGKQRITERGVVFRQKNTLGYGLRFRAGAVSGSWSIAISPIVTAPSMYHAGANGLPVS